MHGLVLVNVYVWCVHCMYVPTKSNAHFYSTFYFYSFAIITLYKVFSMAIPTDPRIRKENARMELVTNAKRDVLTDVKATMSSNDARKRARFIWKLLSFVNFSEYSIIHTLSPIRAWFSACSCSIHGYNFSAMILILCIHTVNSMGSNQAPISTYTQRNFL